jgi:uncharacterized membrane protein
LVGDLNIPAMAAVATAAIPPAAVDAQARRWRAVVWVAAGVFLVVFALLILNRHRTYGTFNFDLGIFDQGLWLLSRGETPFVTLRGLHLFGDHSSYLMLPLVPLYWVLSDVRAMLILTVAVLAIGAPVVWAAARGEGLSPPVSAALAVGYLFHPATQWNTWDNFHPETLTIPLLIGAFALGQRNRSVAMVALLVLVLAAKEDAALVVVPFALYTWWRWRRPGVALVVAGLGIAAFLVNTLVLLPMFSPTGELIYTGRYAQFGEGLGGALIEMVTNPGKVAAELATIDRLGYLAGMLLPLATCLFAPELLLVALPITLANLLSIHVYQHELKWHYTSYLLAVVAMAAVVGARRMLHRRPDIPAGALSLAIVCVAVAGSVAAGPWPGPAGTQWQGWAADPGPVDAVLDTIPDEAVVMADWAIGPHLSHRTTIYEFPVPFRPAFSAWAVPGVPLPPTEEVEYVAVLESISRLVDVAPILDELRADPDFEVIAESSVVLLRRRSDE